MKQKLKKELSEKLLEEVMKRNTGYVLEGSKVWDGEGSYAKYLGLYLAYRWEWMAK